LPDDDGHLLKVTNFEGVRIIGGGSRQIMVTLWPGSKKHPAIDEAASHRGRLDQTLTQKLHPFAEGYA
jgi:hypothetical protein